MPQGHSFNCCYLLNNFITMVIHALSALLKSRIKAFRLYQPQLGQTVTNTQLFAALPLSPHLVANILPGMSH